MAQSNDQIINVGLPRDRWQSVLRVIASRQHDCRAVTEEFPQHDKFVELDHMLEKLKMEIAKQI